MWMFTMSPAVTETKSAYCAVAARLTLWEAASRKTGVRSPAPTCPVVRAGFGETYSSEWPYAQHMSARWLRGVVGVVHGGDVVAPQRHRRCGNSRAAAPAAGNRNHWPVRRLDDRNGRCTYRVVSRTGL